MTPEHRRILALERKVRSMRTDFQLCIASGAALFPLLLKELDLFDPVYRLQMGLLLGVMLLIIVSSVRNVRDARRDAAFREQDFANSIPEVTRPK